MVPVNLRLTGESDEPIVKSFVVCDIVYDAVANVSDCEPILISLTLSDSNLTIIRFHSFNEAVIVLTTSMKDALLCPILNLICFAELYPIPYEYAPDVLFALPTTTLVDDCPTAVGYISAINVIAVVGEFNDVEDVTFDIVLVPLYRKPLPVLPNTNDVAVLIPSFTPVSSTKLEDDSIEYENINPSK
jgi:hypothetical protein